MKNIHFTETTWFFRWQRIQEPGLHLKFHLCSSKNRDITSILLAKVFKKNMHL